MMMEGYVLNNKCILVMDDIYIYISEYLLKKITYIYDLITESGLGALLCGRPQLFSNF